MAAILSHLQCVEVNEICIKVKHFHWTYGSKCYIIKFVDNFFKPQCWIIIFSAEINKLSLKSVFLFTCGYTFIRTFSNKAQSAGSLQLKMYYDGPSYQLIVTIMSASNLPPRDNGQTRNPYCKLYLLPDRR